MTVTSYDDAKRQAIAAAAANDRARSWGASAYSGAGLPFAEYTVAEWAEIVDATDMNPDAAVRESLAMAGRRFWSDYGENYRLLETGEREQLERGLKQVCAIGVGAIKVDHFENLPHQN